MRGAKISDLTEVIEALKETSSLLSPLSQKQQGPLLLTWIKLEPNMDR